MPLLALVFISILCLYVMRVVCTNLPFLRKPGGLGVETRGRNPGTVVSVDISRYKDCS